MSTTTTNMGLVKPELSDAPDITALNANWDIIDSHLYGVAHYAQGTYEGTGLYGSSHKSAITFPDYFLPAMVMIGCPLEGATGHKVFYVVVYAGYPIYIGGDCTFDTYIVKDSDNIIKEFTLQWYANGAGDQMNQMNEDYYWFAIGRLAK